MDKPLHIGFIGSPCTGKSALVVQMIQHNFIRLYIPTERNHYRTFFCDKTGTTHILYVTDAGGDMELEKEVINTDGLAMEHHGFVCVYSVDSRTSFDAVISYYHQILQLKMVNPPPIVLVGNKSDLDVRQVATEEGVELAELLHCPFFETSAKDHATIPPIFDGLLHEIFEKVDRTEFHRESKKCRVM